MLTPVTPQTKPQPAFGGKIVKYSDEKEMYFSELTSYRNNNACAEKVLEISQMLISYKNLGELRYCQTARKMDGIDYFEIELRDKENDNRLVLKMDIDARKPDNKKVELKIYDPSKESETGLIHKYTFEMQELSEKLKAAFDEKLFQKLYMWFCPDNSAFADTLIQALDKIKKLIPPPTNQQLYRELFRKKD